MSQFHQSKHYCVKANNYIKYDHVLNIIALASIYISISGYSDISYSTNATEENYHWNIWNNPPNKCGGSNICIAIVDSGINMSHSAFDVEGKICPFPASRSFIGNERDLKDAEGHGTYCAGIAAGRELTNDNFSGVAYDARLLICKVGWNPSVANVIEALDHIKSVSDSGNRVDIVSMSIGFKSNTEHLDELQRCINRLTDRGIICVAAAGNRGNHPDEAVSRPAIYNNVISVGAHDEFWKIPNFGPNVPGVDYTTLGVGVRVPRCGRRGWFLKSFMSVDGTSMAAPAVAGLIACIFQHERRNFNIDEIKEYLTSMIHQREDLKKIKALWPKTMFDNVV